MKFEKKDALEFVLGTVIGGTIATGVGYVLKQRTNDEELSESEENKNVEIEEAE